MNIFNWMLVSKLCPFDMAMRFELATRRITLYVARFWNFHTFRASSELY